MSSMEEFDLTSNHYMSPVASESPAEQEHDIPHLPSSSSYLRNEAENSMEDDGSILHYSVGDDVEEVRMRAKT